MSRLSSSVLRCIYETSMLIDRKTYKGAVCIIWNKTDLVMYQLANGSGVALVNHVGYVRYHFLEWKSYTLCDQAKLRFVQPCKLRLTSNVSFLWQSTHSLSHITRMVTTNLIRLCRHHVYWDCSWFPSCSPVCQTFPGHIARKLEVTADSIFEWNSHSV